MTLSPLQCDSWLASAPATPFYVYPEQRFRELAKGFKSSIAGSALPVHLHFAVKANNNPHVLNWVRSEGFGLDIVSGGEMRCALTAGFNAEQIVFSGVGKTHNELKHALQAQLASINIESEAEFEMLESLARELNLSANIAFRVNPDVDPQTHPYIATGLYEHKFGVDFDEAFELYARAKKSKFLKPRGLSLHIGSQLHNLNPLVEAIDKTLDLASSLGANLERDFLDIGGGLAVSYEAIDECPDFESYGACIKSAGQRWARLGGQRIFCELGRALSAPIGFLVTRVIRVKRNQHKTFVICDASMTELLRPALYEAKHPLIVLTPHSKGTFTCDLVGPVCESADVFLQNIVIPELKEGDLLALGTSGAYGAVMASHYNGRDLPSEYCQHGSSAELSLSRKGSAFVALGSATP